MFPHLKNFFSSKWTCLFLQHGAQALCLFDVGLCDIPAWQGRAHDVHDLPCKVTYIFPSPSSLLPTVISKANSRSTIVRLHLNLVFTWHLHTGHAGQLSHSSTGAWPASTGFHLCSTPSNTTLNQLDDVLRSACAAGFYSYAWIKYIRGRGVRRSSAIPENISLIQAGQMGLANTTPPPFKTSAHTVSSFTLRQI